MIDQNDNRSQLIFMSIRNLDLLLVNLKKFEHNTVHHVKVNLRHFENPLEGFLYYLV